MDAKEPAGYSTEAERFCTENYGWLVSKCEDALRKRGFAGYGRDLAHDLASICRKISDEVWRTLRSEKAYVYRIIVNEANDFCRQNSHLAEELGDAVLPSSFVEEIEATILLREISGQISDKDNQLLEMLFESDSELEMSEKMGIKYAALRKRIERLKKKLCLICNGKEIARKPRRAPVRPVYRTL